jgi:1-acyl-sn-glycerol-3-phosphate acyltransferase
MELLKQWRRFCNPLFVGERNIPARRPLIFVGNHTTYGLFDTVFLLEWMRDQKGIALRSMGDHVHFQIPLWKDVMTRFGVVDGNREEADRLMAAGECILVFPGGAREVARRKGEKYPVLWKERTGFARLAVKHGCSIVPFSCIGMDDAWDVVADADDILKGPAGPLFQALQIRPDAMMPLVRGLGGTPLPRPERVYFKFGKPVKTSHVKGRHEEADVVMDIREQARVAVETGIAQLLKRREKDPNRNVFRNVAHRLLDKVLG